VLITAALDKLRARLSARGRETAAAAASRLARSDAYNVNDTRLVTIVNDGALDAAAEAFVRLLATLRYSPGVRRRA
jgi:ribose 1,5-bisphosphokinase